MPRSGVGIVEPWNKNDRGSTGTFRLAGGGETMKRKPDIVWVLVLIFGLGVVTTGYTQGLWERSQDSAATVPISHSQQAQD